MTRMRSSGMIIPWAKAKSGVSRMDRTLRNRSMGTSIYLFRWRWRRKVPGCYKAVTNPLFHAALHFHRHGHHLIAAADGQGHRVAGFIFLEDGLEVGAVFDDFVVHFLDDVTE